MVNILLKEENHTDCTIVLAYCYSLNRINLWQNFSKIKKAIIKYHEHDLLLQENVQDEFMAELLKDKKSYYQISRT